MTSNAAVKPQPSPIVACTVSRDVQNFDLLIEDMENEFGENWGDLSFNDATVFLSQAESNALEFIAIAIDEEDESDIGQVADLIRTAVSKNIKALVIAEDVSPVALHQLLKLGAQEFVPYPLPDGALHDALERMRNAARPAQSDVPEEMRTTMRASGNRNGIILPVHGLAGGVGSSTFAVNLAWELATAKAQDGPRVCLLDFDLQFGSVSTFLDLPRREAVYELLSATASMDNDSFVQAMLTFNDKLQVLTAPAEMLPLDIIAPEDVDRILQAARANFDFVVIDMPTSVVHWTETVLNASQVYFALLELDMRSAQNALRLIRALKGEELPVERLRYVLNRAPGFTDLSGKSRVKRMSESLDIQIEVLIPDGGKTIMQSGDHGLPLSETAAKNPVRKEIQKLAISLLQAAHEQATG